MNDSRADIPPGPFPEGQPLADGASRALGTSAADMERAYQEALASQLRYKELFDFAPDGYVVTDNRGVITQANHAAAVLLRRPREFLVGKPLPFLLADESRRVFYRNLASLNEGRVRSPLEWEVIVRPGDALPSCISLTVSAVADDAASGRPTGYRWLLRDVTVRRQTEQALRAEKAFSDNRPAPRG